MTILEALRNPELFGRLRPFRDPSTWAAWFCFLRALFALPLDEAELTLYQTCTGRTDLPTVESGEAAAIVGRRGGKSFIASVLALYLALLVDWQPHLSPGEKAHVLIIGQSMRPARRTLLGYIKGMLREIPVFSDEVEVEYVDELHFKCGTTVGVWPPGFGARHTRGLTVAAAILDEVDYFFHDGPHAAEEVVGAVRPAMASLPGSKLIAISSPYIPTGWLHKFHQEHWGRADGALVWQAPSATMNPTLSAERIAQAYQEDPERAAAEFGAVWRAGQSALFTPDLVDACVRDGPTIIPPAAIGARA